MHYNYEVGQEVENFHDHDIPVGLIITNKKCGDVYLWKGDNGWSYINTGSTVSGARYCYTIEYVPEGHNKVVQPEVGDILTKEQIKALPDNSTMLYTFYEKPHGIWIKKGQELFTVDLGRKSLQGFTIKVNHLTFAGNDKFELLYIGEES